MVQFEMYIISRNYRNIWFKPRKTKTLLFLILLICIGCSNNFNNINQEENRSNGSSYSSGMPLKDIIDEESQICMEGTFELSYAEKLGFHPPIKKTKQNYQACTKNMTKEKIVESLNKSSIKVSDLRDCTLIVKNRVESELQQNLTNISYIGSIKNVHNSYWSVYNARVWVTLDFQLMSKNQGNVIPSGKVIGAGTDSVERNWSFSTKEDALKEAYSKAVEIASRKFVENLEKPSELAEVMKKRRELEEFPADILLAMLFEDQESVFPNMQIDALETSNLVVEVENHGKGTAFDVLLDVQADNSLIKCPREVKIGDIQPNEKKTAKVEISAEAGLASGATEFRINAKEKRGFNSKTYVLKVATAALNRPNIEIVSYRLNDDRTGSASGNGNGIAENGETIELIALVKNTGVGEALKVETKIRSINSGVDVKKATAVIDKIMPGQTADAALVFHIPPTCVGSGIEVKLEARDVRGIAESRQVFALNTQSRLPVLAYRHTIIDHNKNGFLENGEEGELEIIAQNKGQLEARDVMIRVESDDVELYQKSAAIARIEPSGQYIPQRFAFKVPRTIAKDNISIRLSMSQKDFSGFEDTIIGNLKLSRPVYTIAHKVNDRGNRNGQLEEGETADVLVWVQNTGNLDGTGVKLKLATDSQRYVQEGVRLMSLETVTVGQVAAGAQSQPVPFTLFIQRTSGTAARELNLNFSIEQQDFQIQVLPLALKINKEKEEIITVARQGSPQPVAPPPYAGMANSPPMVAIGMPLNEQRVAGNKQVVVGSVVDDKGLANIEILLNGQRQSQRQALGQQGNVSGQKQQAFNFELPLQVGENVITVRAYDDENLSGEQTVVVYRESEHGRIYAAVIGIDDYKNVPKLRYACKDAKAFADYLRSQMGLENDQIIELYNQNATASNIKHILGEKLKQLAYRSEDTVFIFFAGHGAPEADPNSKDPDGITKYLVPYDADPKLLYSTAIPMYEVANIFGRIQAERLVFISDACFSGAAGGLTLPGMRSTNLSDSFLDMLAQGKGRIILTSSAPNEISHESDKLGHGIFTYYLIEGLRGKADSNKDNFISTDEISIYLKKEVSAATNGAQHPVMKGYSEGSVIIGKYLK